MSLRDEFRAAALEYDRRLAERTEARQEENADTGADYLGAIFAALDEQTPAEPQPVDLSDLAEAIRNDAPQEN